jgi:hypothetical protein
VGERVTQRTAVRWQVFAWLLCAVVHLGCTRRAPILSRPPVSWWTPDAAPPEAGGRSGSPAAASDPAVLPGAPVGSHALTWTCVGSPCPWGEAMSGHAVAWAADAGAVRTRLGYTASEAIYLPAVRANGAEIAIASGVARAQAGFPGAIGHRVLATIEEGQTYRVAGLGAGEVLSVQGDLPFSYLVALPDRSEPPDAPAAPRRDVVSAIRAFWRCHARDCSSADWTGAVVSWPAWSAHHSNARRGDQARAVFSAHGAPLYPYMGRWAHGCEVTAESGSVLIIEWKRGSDRWRETTLAPGQTHVIRLVPPENGAMIESYEGSPGFSVSLRNCTPRRLR